MASRIRMRRCGPAVSLLALSIATSTSCLAERWQLDLSASTDVTVTDNSRLSAENPVSDAVVTVRPRFVLSGEGARLKIFGTGSVDAIWYSQGTQESRALPDLDVNASLIAIERVLTLEAGVRVSQLFENPYGLRVDTTTEDVLTTTQLRLTPVIEISPRPGTIFRLRSDNTRVWDDSQVSATTSTATGYFGRHVVFLEQEPQPVGWRLEAERSVTRYDNSATDDLVIDVARAVVTRQFGGQFIAGIRVGYENNNFIVGNEPGAVYGLEVHWQPSERTNLDGFGEHRFFGPSWRVGFAHRMPWLSMNVLLKRDLVSSPQALFQLPPTQNVSSLLDSLLTTRIPDPVARSRQVQQVIAESGLPESLNQGTTVYSQRISLETLSSVSLAYLHGRGSLVLSGYRSLVEDVPDTGPLASGLAINNNVQIGASLAASWRMTPLMTITGEADWSRIESLEAASTTQLTTQRGVELILNYRLAPKTSGHFGARYRQFDQTAQPHNSEHAAFVGLDHRF